MERLALETGVSTWEATAAAIANRLVPTRAAMALETFRQLILDAQAMMDPDFAGKLAADVAEAGADDADADFCVSRAAAEDRDQGDRGQGGRDQGNKGTREQENAGADFGGDESQIPLLDASHFSAAGQLAEEAIPRHAGSF